MTINVLAASPSTEKKPVATACCGGNNGADRVSGEEDQLFEEFSATLDKIAARLANDYRGLADRVLMDSAGLPPEAAVMAALVRAQMEHQQPPRPEVQPAKDKSPEQNQEQSEQPEMQVRSEEQPRLQRGEEQREPKGHTSEQPAAEGAPRAEKQAAAPQAAQQDKAEVTQQSAPQIPAGAEQQAQPVPTAEAVLPDGAVTEVVVLEEIPVTASAIPAASTLPAAVDDKTTAEDIPAPSLELEVEGETQPAAEEELLKGEAPEQTPPAAPAVEQPTSEVAVPELEMKTAPAASGESDAAAPVETTAAPLAETPAAPSPEPQITDDLNLELQRPVDHARNDSQRSAKAAAVLANVPAYDRGSQTAGQVLAKLASAADYTAATRPISSSAAAPSAALQAAIKAGLQAADANQAAVAPRFTATAGSFEAKPRLEQPREPRFVSRPLLFKNMEKVESALKEAARARDGKTISLRLDPPSLGTVRVDVTLKEGNLHARLTAESPQVSLMLRERAYELQGMLRKLGLQVDRVTVAVVNQDFVETDGGGGRQRPASQDGRAPSPGAGNGGGAGSEHSGSALGRARGEQPRVLDHWIA